MQLMHSLSHPTTLSEFRDAEPKLRSALSQARNRNNRIAKENLQLRKDYDELKVKYAKVLGMNQKLQEKRLIKL